MAEESNPSPEGATLFESAARPRRLHHPWRSPGDLNPDPGLRTAELYPVKLRDRYLLKNFLTCSAWMFPSSVRIPGPFSALPSSAL